MKNGRKNIKEKSENTITKNIKQYVFDATSQEVNELLEICHKYNKVRNYVFSRFSGIESLLLIQNSDKNIRDV